MRWTLESEARRNLNWQRGRSLLISGGGTGRARSRQQAQKKKGKKRQYASVHRKRKEYRPPDEAPSNGGSAAVSPNLLCREGRVIQCPCFEGANRSLPFARHSSLAVSSPRKPGGSALFFFVSPALAFSRHRDALAAWMNFWLDRSTLWSAVECQTISLKSPDEDQLFRRTRAAGA